MQFDDYQEITRSTAIYPDAGTGKWGAISYAGLGLGEAGEVQGKIKKIWRDDNGQVTEKAKAAIGSELGDVLWYVARLADELGLTLNDLASQNLHKLLDRKERGVIGGSGDNR